MVSTSMPEKPKALSPSTAITCCLLTTAANAVLAPVHDRMPVIVMPADYDVWLDPETPIPAARKKLAALAR